MDNLEARVRELINNRFEDTDNFLVDVSVSAAQKIQVYIDHPSNIKLDVCVEISRYLEEHLEAEGIVNEKYLLEVSSPGMSNPFKVIEQYYKSLEKAVTIILKDGIQKDGILKSIDAEKEEITLEEHIPTKKKKIVTKLITLSLSDILRTKRKFTF